MQMSGETRNWILIHNFKCHDIIKQCSHDFETKLAEMSRVSVRETTCQIREKENGIRIVKAGLSQMRSRHWNN